MTRVGLMASQRPSKVLLTVAHHEQKVKMGFFLLDVLNVNFSVTINFLQVPHCSRAILGWLQRCLFDNSWTFKMTYCSWHPRDLKDPRDLERSKRPGEIKEIWRDPRDLERSKRSDRSNIWGIRDLRNP